MSKKKNKLKGNYGENLACSYLLENGYDIIAKNFNCQYGEIDIIAIYDDEVVFIEVKTRCQSIYGEPIESIDLIKKYHIYKTAKYFLYKSNLLNSKIRFDIIEVFLEDSEYFKYNLSHTQNIILDEPQKIRKKI